MQMTPTKKPPLSKQQMESQTQKKLEQQKNMMEEQENILEQATKPGASLRGDPGQPA